MRKAMTNELEVLEEQSEKLKNAVKALTSFSRSPQQRLDSALSYFVRTFRDPPEGEASVPYGAVYAAVGSPPVGTTVHVLHERLSAEELETVSTALVDLCEVLVRQCAQMRAIAGAAAPEPVATSTIGADTLETLVPSRSADR
jgi:hypothetical protein